MTWRIGDPVIPDPFGDGIDFHLLFESQSPGASSWIYVPCATAPGLSLDSIRIDRIAPSPQPVASIVENLRGLYARFAAPRPLQFSLIDSFPADVLFSLEFEEHPLLGSQQSRVRYRRTAADIAIQTIRKLVPSGDDAARIRFLRQSPIAYGAARAYDAAAVSAQQASAALQGILEDMARTGRLNMTSEQLARHLARASPLLQPYEWWTLAALMGRHVLDEGETDRFEATVRYLELAVVALNDLRGQPGVDDLLFDIALTLAELLAYLPALGRAPALFEAAAVHWESSDPRKALGAEVMAALLAVIAEGHEELPVATVLSARAGAWLDIPGGTEAAVDVLMSYSARAAHVGRRGTPESYGRAALAADLAQVLYERGLASGRRVAGNELGQLSVINAAQVRTQMLVHGVTQQDLDDTVRLMPAVFGSGQSQRASLVFLRSLVSARRTVMDNRFPWRDRVPVPSTRQALTRISIEAALHLALARSFQTSSLGGPADVFGMQRGVLLQAADPNGIAWRRYAELMIRYAGIVLVLYGESEGLLWELSEIVRQRACARTVLVIAPEQPGAPVSSPALLQRAGYDVSGADFEPGFLFFDSSCVFESRLDFDSLWNGALASALVKRVGTGTPIDK